MDVDWYVNEEHVNNPHFNRFLIGCNNDHEEALRRWKNTCIWRRNENINSILLEPHEHFTLIRKYYPQYLHRKSKNGHFVYIEQPGLGKLNHLLELGFTKDELLRHYIVLTEFCWRILAPEADAKILSIFDGKELLKNNIKIIGEHYPERSFKLFVINCPLWGRGVWNMISPFIDPNTRDKVEILGSNYINVLTKYIDKSCIPPELGGTDTYHLGDSPEEQLLKKYIENALNENGENEKNEKFIKNEKNIESDMSSDYGNDIIDEYNSPCNHKIYIEKNNVNKNVYEIPYIIIPNSIENDLKIARKNIENERKNIENDREMELIYIWEEESKKLFNKMNINKNYIIKKLADELRDAVKNKYV
eukprot:GHVL01007431.1.p1 GENE.GHVL01007431.1~~GHVL01007431.1.p1  ORF type:complete len:362 (-),score=89.82 GHVL01007431.1:7-1092(-)